MIDHIRIQMWNAADSILLFERFLPAHYHYGLRPVIAAHAAPEPAR